MPALQEYEERDPPQPFRLDVQVHELLTKSPAPRPQLMPSTGDVKFPEPVFPQHPNLLEQDDNYEENLARARARKRNWTAPLVLRAMNGWLFPYIKSRVLPGPFHPIIAYLFTEWKCNLDCHYCWAFDNSVKGMTEEVAKRSIDWLHSTTCRVLAFMGGEPMLRPQLVHKACYYAAKKGFWIYMPTNARLLRPDVIDRLADAGVAIFNFAVDVVDEKPGLAKALTPVRKYFDYLVRKQYKYGYAVFFNINICRNTSRRCEAVDRDRA
ncbi:MAG: radical SAM protein [Terriglobales bacterium]